MSVARATRTDLGIALERIHALDFFGIVELFEASIIQMKKYLSKDFGKINTSYNVQNKSQGRKDTLTERLKELQNSLTPVLYDELIEKNTLDLELYNAALELFNIKMK